MNTMTIKDLKRLSVSQKIVITGDFREWGVITAVQDGARWIFKNRKNVSENMRTIIDAEMNQFLRDFEEAVPGFPICETCSSFLEENICIPCNTEA